MLPAAGPGPLSAATFAPGMLAFPTLGENVEERFFRALFWGLVALTVPRVVLHHLDQR